ncbi:MAG: transposase [Aerococcus sp.]|nr:transposase [Aerococcus sp.]
MTKYNYEFKRKVVNNYLNGKGGFKLLARKYGIAYPGQIRKWLIRFNALGNEGLKVQEGRRYYSFERKLDIVQLYLSTTCSYQNIATREGIPDASFIAQWVRIF